MAGVNMNLNLYSLCGGAEVALAVALGTFIRKSM